jgi:hypothetical protein
MAKGKTTAREKSWKDYATVLKGDRVKIVEAPGVHSKDTFVVSDVHLKAGGPMYELAGFHRSLPRQRLKKVARG